MLAGVALDFIRRRCANCLLLALLAAAAALLAVPAAEAATPKPAKASVMSRNVFLGADLTPGVKATSLQGLVTAAGVVLKQVDDNKFGVRAKGLGAEIVSENPDLVGLQEVALWRTEPCTESPLPPHATEVRYDFLQLLLTAAQQGQEPLPHGDLAARVRLRGLGERRRQRVDHGPGLPDGERVQRPADDARRDPRPQRSASRRPTPRAQLRHAAPGAAGGRRPTSPGAGRGSTPRCRERRGSASSTPTRRRSTTGEQPRHHRRRRRQRRDPRGAGQELFRTAGRRRAPAGDPGRRSELRRQD